MNRDLGRLAMAAVMTLAPLVAAPAPASAEELRLVFDIPLNHPRVPYFTAMVDSVAKSTSGRLTLTANPGGTIYPGFASIEALKDGKAELTFVNAANLERLDPRFGFINLPFALDDTAMARPATRRGVVELLDNLAQKQELRVIGLMRGADQLFVFRDKRVATSADLKSLKIRVAGAGIYEEIMRRLSAEPVVLPIPEMKPAFARGALDGVFTSPGAWTSQLGMTAPKATHAPGLMMITYALVARKDAVERLPAADREALLAAARADITEGWERMEADDAAILKDMAAKGAAIVTVTDLKPWREAVSQVAATFSERFPDIWREFQVQIRPRGN
ncbi:TRAP transporter substrate-binding protein DctP [Xanthobacter dioxanivorans]|uniref:TRAP transporter substrate-binding protein DctP n=1 Tax=Xanthobacter dioxanivorans TaxID=2528964 RepID=A0A974SIZ5_9HYPH|nr:TRAP transporter substrate-binding protein DctP [Xanthobacter dioxanivorans]QRG07255.1 TRAP transporter substrate-binding protein DctP [Xanthobacter dioxanivorans]